MLGLFLFLGLFGVAVVGVVVSLLVALGISKT